MTHVELLTIEKNKYIEDGKASLAIALDWLMRNAEHWDKNHEEIYLESIAKATANLNKAAALNDILCKLGVF
jgi:hypothetical protein